MACIKLCVCGWLRVHFSLCTSGLLSTIHYLTNKYLVVVAYVWWAEFGKFVWQNVYIYVRPVHICETSVNICHAYGCKYISTYIVHIFFRRACLCAIWMSVCESLVCLNCQNINIFFFFLCVCCWCCCRLNLNLNWIGRKIVHACVSGAAI